MALLLAPSVAHSDQTNNVVLGRHAGDLVCLKRDELVGFNSGQFLSARYTLLYFGAGWCPDCRRFSPALVRAYDALPKAHKPFEVLLLTMDKTEDGLLKFMRTEKMNFPALAFARMSGAEDLKKFYSGHGIPCLTLIDQQGTVLLQSKSDQDANEVLKEAEELVKRTQPATAPTH
jgi:thiol-disulfide isomerase/thioredoxin